MRRQVGIAGLQRQAREKEQFRRMGDQLAATQLQQLQDQMVQFKSSLELFATKHRAEIARNPAFRRQFAQMCAGMGVDLLTWRLERLARRRRVLLRARRAHHGTVNCVARSVGTARPARRRGQGVESRARARRRGRVRGRRDTRRQAARAAQRRVCAAWFARDERGDGGDCRRAKGNESGRGSSRADAGGCRGIETGHSRGLGQDHRVDAYFWFSAGLLA
ncbi:hypothetical protein AMAG_14182 [Allomyces macrogynus ATCC 38327]|uniref:Uncharacterized protein n=1 Tax=Allomyces macrogynus (strain ATCC 38327) TaxID=578462 RepID=A0A0L0T4G5_ALLM3|nr:hypothetical protein AMAG_14182 [Allomyces macrogynus ATCC 38327]|eukprot:KNE69627.1 hypothetical protein AMAG_14182 [Allomyces macrogynus ATCC 38327]